MILLSTDPEVGPLLEMALGAHEPLIVVAGEEELRAALDSPASTVVIDLPADERLQAFQRVRALHSGMVLVTLDGQAEIEDWPPDLARRSLVRPLRAEEVVAALAVRPGILREPAAARRRRLAQARRPPVVPPAAPAADEALGPTEPARRLSSRESLWEEPREPAPLPVAIDRSLPAPDHAHPDPAAPDHAHPAGRRRWWLIAAAMVALLLATAIGGIAIGRATAGPEPTRLDAAVPPVAPRTPSAAAPGVVIKEKAPEACNAALSDADAAISYLVGNIRDQRLSDSMQRYQENRRACREASR